uniref:ribonuclease E n=1 Tax=Rhodaphanes brevistipitata TaxID=446136 RepID=UPI001FCDE250|nr:ribonuclease E [Rhodaphanes brevistipitata]UNJ18577.1 ribonuclease E [Rhodaphanes brevistipitata]
MEKNIIVSSLSNLAAILHDGYLYEFIINDPIYQLGNIYIGTVTKIFPTIRAIFVTVQINSKYQNGFIHANDLLSLKKQKFSSTSSIVIFKQKLYVQVVKEAFFGKNPRLTINVTLAGRYIIFSPVNKVVCISRKILDSNEKEYLKSLAILLRPLAHGGIFFRYSASKVNNSVIIQEWEILKFRWKILLKITNSSFCLPNMLIYQDSNILKKTIRDFYKPEIQSIFIDSSKNLKKLRIYLNYWDCYIENPNLETFVLPRYFTYSFKINSSIAQASKFRVELIPAGYIFIELFEALTIIDVNSGIFDRQKYPLSLILILNCSAAKEIAYQIKIRNISGLIIIDFIDMLSKKDQLELLRYLHKLFRNDKAHTQIVQFSELGLVELTRKRIGKNIIELLNNYQKNFFVSVPHTDLEQSINYNKLPKTKSNYLSSRFFLKDVTSQIDFIKKYKEISNPFNFKNIYYSKTKYFLNNSVQKLKILIK